MASEQLFNIRFVQLIENYPCLYDPTHKRYNNKVVTEKAWNKIATEFSLTVKECKVKWKNIRTVFRRHLYSTQLSGFESASKKKYYLSDVLQYVTPFLKNSKTSQIINSSFSPTETADNDEELDTSMAEIVCVGMDDQESNAEFIDNPEIPTISSSNPTDFRKHHECNCKSKDTLNYIMENYFKAKSVAIEDSTSLADERFLLSLKQDLKEMNTRQKITFKKRIYELIEDIITED